MIRRSACVTVALILASVSMASGTHQPAIAVNAVLYASPSQGHSSDVIYVSGTGFHPGHRPVLLMMCPGWWDRSSVSWNNYSDEKEGPPADAQGEFKAFKFQVIALHHLSSSGCQIYDTNTPIRWGPDIPASYLILPPDQQPLSCERYICVNVRAQPTRVRAGLFENIDVKSNPPEQWGGAAATVTITYPHAQMQKPLVLGAGGTGRLRIQIPIHVTQPVVARVKVHVRLGNYVGDRGTTFTVIH